MKLTPNHSGSAIETCAQLAALFEADTEWEAAERVRVLLYHALRGNSAAAQRILNSLCAQSADRSSVLAGGQSEIRRRIAELASLLEPREFQTPSSSE
jgi:hypothetical protein